MNIIIHRKKLLLLFLGYFFFNHTVTAQSPVSINPLTGAVNVTIPIYTVRSGTLTLPLSLSYFSNGIKPKDVEGTAGIGWGLQAGGQISRVINGLPDDCTKDNAGTAMYGWMISANTGASAVNAFAIQNDGGITCSKEVADNNYINTNMPYNYDTEPDIFSVSAPGLSCQLVYDRATAQFQPITYQDIHLTVATDPGTGLITSFVITNDKGIRYEFAAPNTIIKTTELFEADKYFGNTFKRYQHGITFSDSWSLTKISDTRGNTITLQYGTSSFRRSTDYLTLYMPNSTLSTNQFTTGLATTSVFLTSISVNNGNIYGDTFTIAWITGDLPGQTGQTIISSITQGLSGRVFQFNYDKLFYAATGTSRSFLRNLTDAGCSTPNSYGFSYAGQSDNTDTTLPDSSAIHVDYWGYATSNSNTTLMPKVWINPANSAYQRYSIYEPATGGGSYTYSTTNGNNRAAALTNFDAGSLTGITYAQGGSTTIAYEPNNYIDVPSNQVIAGGGIRVRQTTDYDGIDVSKNIVRNYSYNNPTTGLTSGKPLSLPVYAFTIPYSGTATGQALWDNVTVLSDNDLSNEDHTIMYEYSKVSQTGAGSTQYQYFLPATNWDATASPDCSGCSTEWAPVINNAARTNCTSTYGQIKNDIYSYPFIPNPNYDFERGVLKKMINYNDAGAEVSESAYTYQRSFSPSVITGFKYEDNPDASGALLVKNYNKYKIYYNTSELGMTETKKVFDLPALTQAHSSTTNFIYGSANHKLLTQLSVTNSDNAVYSTNFKYAKDYIAVSGANPNVTGIYYLQQNNDNALIETWQQVTRSGVTETVGANLTLFKTYNPGGVPLFLPQQQLKLIQPDGIPSTASPAAFAPYAISGQTSTYDPRYFPVTNFDTYDVTGYPATVDDANKNITTTLIDHTANQPVAIFSNAAYSEVAFTNFDADIYTPQNYNFSISGNPTQVAGHVGNGQALSTSQTISKTVTKNASAQNYIFSIWINAATAGSLTFSLVGTTTYTYTKTFNAGVWTYYEWRLPVTNMPGTFTINATSSQAISIDDIIFYPDVARASTRDYDPTSHYKVAETNTNGIAAYYKNDIWGRLLSQYDQDKNIVARKLYETPNSIATNLSLTVSTPANIYLLTPATFNASDNPCISGITYQWDFGDGTIITGLNGQSQSHTYQTEGNFTITVTASHPVFGTKTDSFQIAVNLPPLNVYIQECGSIQWSNCTVRSITTIACGTDSPDPSHTYYSILSISGNVLSETLFYQWQESTDGGVSWSNVGSNSTQYTVPRSGHMVATRVRCAVRSTSGQTGTSDSAFFDTQACN